MKLFKLFPVAVAAFALASCSSDDLKDQAVSTNANALRFSIEDTNTRAGVVGDATDAISALQFRWTKDDKIRVYDENLAMYDVYEYGGTSFAENPAEAEFTNPAPWDEKKLTSYSVGVYPNSSVEAVYLDKTDRGLKHIEMTLPESYIYEAPDLAKEAYRCDMPMYGNIDNVATGVTQMNFLTAWTRIYMRNIPTDVKYIAVVSKNAAQPLTGLFEAQVHYPLQSTDEPWLKTKAATDDGTWGNLLYAALPTITEEAAKGGICFPLPVQKYDNLTIYGLKESAGLTPDAVNAGTPDAEKTAWDALVAAGKAIEIATRNDVPFTRRRQCWSVLYTYTYYLDTDPVDPFRPGEVSKVLADNADNIIGNFRIVPYSSSDASSPIDPTKAKKMVSGEGDYYTHRIEIPNIKAGDKAKIFLDFSGAGIQYDEALQIYDKNPETNQFNGEITIIPGKIQGGSDKAKIEVNLPQAKVWIVGDGANIIGNVDIQNAKEVHIGDGETATLQDNTRTVVVKGGKLYIEDKADIKKVYAQAYAGNPTQHAEEIIVNAGGQISDIAYIQTKCNITLNGAGYDASTSKLYTGTANDGLASINKLSCVDVKDDITIYSQGDARIGRIDAPTLAKKKLNLLTINSKMFQKSATDKAPTKGRALGSLVIGSTTNAVVFTASQLTKLTEGTTANTTVVADVIDMNNVEWTGGALANDFVSQNYNSTTNKWNDLTVDAQKEVSTKTGKTTIKNVVFKKPTASGNGLFATCTNDANIKGFILEGVKMQENQNSPLDAPLGTLVGNATAKITVNTVEVKNLAFSSQDGNIMGGLIGSISGADAVINNTSVAGAITGRGFGGGLIGQLNANDATFTNCSANVSFTHSMAGTTLKYSYAGTFGAFVGGALGAADVIVYDGKFGTALTKAQKGNGINNAGLCFGAIMTDADIPYFGGNPWIGRFTGSSVGTLTTYKTIKNATAKRQFYQYTYFETSMVQKRFQATSDGGWEVTAQKTINSHKATSEASKSDPLSINYSGTSDDLDSKTTTNWIMAAQYGMNIYSRYNEMTYDNTYVDGVTE